MQFWILAIYIGSVKVYFDMRVAALTFEDKPAVGMVSSDEKTVSILDLPPKAAAKGVLPLIGRSNSELPQVTGTVPLDEVTLRAPVPEPRRNLFCVGKNYHEHALEFSASGFDSGATADPVPTHPIIFSKLPESVVPTGAAIKIDRSVSEAIDYEAELAVIIGKEARGVAATDALDVIWGYTLVNDVTARDLQARHKQWLIGKSQDTFCPMGPWAVTKDEIDLNALTIRGLVNDEVRQEASVAQLIFDIPTIIATISAGITLKPGDVICTGTPAGVGIGFDPPKYLAAGDIVRVEIEGIGTLENPVEWSG